MSLTHAGRILRDEFLQINRSVDAAIKKVREADYLNFATITVGFLNSLSRSHVIRPILRALQEKFPEVFFIIKLYEHVELRNRLFDGELDLCMSGCTDWPGWPNVQVDLLDRNPLCLVTGADSEMAREIAAQPDGLPTQDIMSRYMLIKVPDDVHLGEGPDYSYISRRDTAVAPDMNTMLLHIASGFGFACLAGPFSGFTDPDYKLFPAPFEPQYIDMILARREDMKSPIVLEAEKEMKRVYYELFPEATDRLKRS